MISRSLPFAHRHPPRCLFSTFSIAVPSRNVSGLLPLHFQRALAHRLPSFLFFILSARVTRASRLPVLVPSPPYQEKRKEEGLLPLSPIPPSRHEVTYKLCFRVNFAGTAEFRNFDIQ